MPILTPDRFITAMERTAAILNHIAAPVPQLRAQSARDGADGWSVLEVICHLRDFDEIFYSRARLIAESVGEAPTLTAYDHEAMAVERAYNSQDLAGVLASFAATRGQFVAWLKSRGEGEWGKEGIHPEMGRITLLEQAVQVVTHDVNHTEQILRILATNP